MFSAVLTDASGNPSVSAVGATGGNGATGANAVHRTKSDNASKEPVFSLSKKSVWKQYENGTISKQKSKLVRWWKGLDRDDYLGHVYYECSMLSLGCSQYSVPTSCWREKSVALELIHLHARNLWQFFTAHKNPQVSNPSTNDLVTCYDEYDLALWFNVAAKDEHGLDFWGDSSNRVMHLTKFRTHGRPNLHLGKTLEVLLGAFDVFQNHVETTLKLPAAQLMLGTHYSKYIEGSIFHLADRKQKLQDLGIVIPVDSEFSETASNLK